MRFAKYLTVCVLIVASVCLAANTRNRISVGYRGRLATALTGRQTTGGDLLPGVGNDRFASLVGQGVGPRTGVTLNTCHRIPILFKAANGDYLLFCDCRTSSTAVDNSGYAIIMFRSTDGGRTWGNYTTVYQHATYDTETDWIIAGSVVCNYQSAAGNLHYFFTRATGAVHAATAHTVFVTTSTDHGVTWGAPVDITASCKVANSGTTPNGHGFPATDWTHCVPTCTAGIQLKQGSNAGRMIVPFDHRITNFSSSTTTKSHCIKSDDGGVTWGLWTDGSIGGLDQTNASNDGSNECAITETGTPGRLVMHIRDVNSGTSRYQSVSTNSGGTWSTRAALTNLISPSSSADVKQCGNLTVASYIGDRSLGSRSVLCLATSNDEGATWPAGTARIQTNGAYAGYSSLLVDGNNVLLAYEAGNGNPPANSLPVYCYSIRLLRTTKSWLQNPTPRYSQHFYNEESTGVVVRTIGTHIPDYGNLDIRATGGTTAAPPTYTADGIALASGTADKITLLQADDTGLDVAAADSFTAEVEATITAASNGMLAGKYSGSAGWQLECNSGKLKGTIGDGTVVRTLTGATTINDGVRRVYGLVRDVTADTINVTINGVADATAVSDTTTATLIQTGVPLIVGDNNAGTLSIAATIHSDRYTRGVPASMLTSPVPKKTQSEKRGYSTPALTFPALTGSAVPKLWLFRTDGGALDAYADLNCTERYQLPLATGAAFRSFVDNDSRRRRWSGSEGQRSVWSSDSKMGPCYDMDWVSGTSFNGAVTNTTAIGATNGYDFVQNTGTFTICGCFNFKATTAANQMIFGTNDLGNAAGFGAYFQNSTAKILLYSYGSGSQFNEAIAGGPTLSYGLTYYIAIVGQGTGNKVKLFSAPITVAYSSSSPTQPTISSGDSTANFGSVAGQPFAGAGPTLAAARSDGTNMGNYYCKNLMIFSESLTNTTDHEKLALYSVSQ